MTNYDPTISWFLDIAWQVEATTCCLHAHQHQYFLSLRARESRSRTVQRQSSSTQSSETRFSDQPIHIKWKEFLITTIEGKWGKQVQGVPWQCLIYSSKCNIKSDLLSGDPQHMWTENQPQNVCNWSCCRPTGVRERPGPLPGLCRCLAADCFSILGFNQQV